MSRRLFNTGQSPFVGASFETLGFIDYFHHRPHGLMADAAELVAWHEMLAGPIKASGQGGDVAWNEHGVDVGALDKEAVDCVGARRAENDRRVGRHDDALRREGVLLADDAHRHRTIRLGRTAEIALDELALAMPP